MKLSIKRFDENIPLPRYEKMAAGFDFYCRKAVVIKPREIKAIPSNVAIEVPEGYTLFIVPRSGMPTRFGLLMPHSIGIVDPFYNGNDNEIVFLVYNFTNKPTRLNKGDKIAQGILIRYEKAEFQEVSKLGKSKRPRWKPRRN